MEFLLLSRQLGTSGLFNNLEHFKTCFIHSRHWSTDEWRSRVWFWSENDHNVIIMIRISSTRFRHPRPIDSWEGVKETKNLPNSCIQVAQCATNTFLCNISFMSGFHLVEQITKLNRAGQELKIPFSRILQPNILPKPICMSKKSASVACLCN